MRIYLHISKKSCTFAVDLALVKAWVHPYNIPRGDADLLCL